MASDEPADKPGSDSTRRGLIKLGAAMSAATLMGIVPDAVRAGAWAGGSDAPEKREVRIGFIPLTDCASVVIASALQFDRKYGITIVPSRQASWASIRDKLVSGEIDAAHVLYGLVYGVHLGIGGARKNMAALMALNHNGQAITLSSKLHAQGVSDGASLAARMAADKRGYAFAQTFPTGTHAMWLHYWLAAQGIDPYVMARAITVPPPQMVASVRAGHIDGFCAGEPWNHRAIADGVGFTVATTQDIWPDHPEKVLGATAEFVERCPNTARAMTAAIIDAGRWIDATPSHRAKAAEIIAGRAYIDTDQSVILARMLGHYDNGIGRRWHDAHAMTFYNDGLVPFPFISDGMWFMTQQRRWGLLKSDPDYFGVASAVNRVDLYREAATAAGASVPAQPMRSARLIDGIVWDGRDPARYAMSAPLHA